MAPSNLSSIPMRRRKKTSRTMTVKKTKTTTRATNDEPTKQRQPHRPVQEGRASCPPLLLDDADGGVEKPHRRSARDLRRDGRSLQRVKQRAHPFQHSRGCYSGPHRQGNGLARSYSAARAWLHRPNHQGRL